MIKTKRSVALHFIVKVVAASITLGTSLGFAEPPCNCTRIPKLEHLPTARLTPRTRSAAASRKTERVPGCIGLVEPAPRDCYASLIARIAPTQVQCYKSVFQQETSCHYDCTQAKGHAGNGAVGYGLCTIEKDPALRRSNGRGRACDNITTAARQVECCISIMRNSRSYFGSATPKC